MDESKSLLTPEQIEAFQKGLEFDLSSEEVAALKSAYDKVIQACREFFDALVEVYKIIIERIREIATSLARFFLKLQLLEWKIPYPIADFVSKNIYWYWAMRLGFDWFERKFALIE